MMRGTSAFTADYNAWQAAISYHYSSCNNAFGGCTIRQVKPLRFSRLTENQSDKKTTRQLNQLTL
jgi:hypothetical protein